MAKNRVTRSLYRSLIKVARNFDSIPACKSLLYRTEIYHNHSSPAAKYYTNLLNRLFDKDSFLLKPKDDSISLVNLVREETRAIKDDVGTADRLDAGFAALRKLSSLWGIYSNRGEDEEEEDDDDSPSPALDELEAYSLLKSDVKLSTALASGVLLVAHPMLQGPLHRSVILLLEHNSKGSYGVVINHRTGLSVDSTVMNLPENILNVFGNNSVAFGGMVRRLTYLHDVPQVGGISIPTCKKPLFAGGEIAKALSFVKEARNAAKAVSAAAATATNPATPVTGAGDAVTDDVIRTSPEGTADGYTATESVIEVEPADRFRFFVGCCLWEGGNLEKELASGYWIPTHSEPDVVLELAMVTAVIPDSSDDSDSDMSEDVVQGSEAIVKKNKTVAKEAIESIMNSELSDSVKDAMRDVEGKLQSNSAAQPSSQKVIKDGKDVKDGTDEAEEEEEEEEEEEDDERYSVDVWKALLRSLGEPYANMADIPSWVSAKEIESADWK